MEKGKSTPVIDIIIPVYKPGEELRKLLERLGSRR